MVACGEVEGQGLDARVVANCGSGEDVVIGGDMFECRIAGVPGKDGSAGRGGGREGNNRLRRGN